MKLEIPFDYAAWRFRMNWTLAQAAAYLYCSRSHYYKLEQRGKGAGVYAWAAYGLECFHAAQKAQRA